MHQPSSSPFAEFANHLYTSTSFETPPPQVVVPSGPEAWVYYEPVDAEQAQPFSSFMRTPEFRQAQRQIERRIAECQAFADEHFSPDERSRLRGGFETFLQHLKNEDGVGYFGEAALQLLYSLGKRSLDSFCMLLHHPDIELHQRQCAVRELAGQVEMCRGAGPAFMSALAAVVRPEGSLRSTFWQASRDLLDQAVLEFSRRLHAGAPPEWLASMEIHIVNRFRLELDLPGADPHDRFSLGETLVSSKAVGECAIQLLNECRPVQVALLMAEQYRTRLTELATQELSPPGAGESSFKIDPSQDHHMDALLRAQRSLQHAFQGVTLNSLVAQDPDSGVSRWRGSDALAARELLLELGRQKLVRPPEPRTVFKGTTTDSVWALQHLDHRLPFVVERVMGGPAEMSIPRLHHLRPLMTDKAVLQMLRDAALDAVLRDEPSQALKELPANWLKTEDQFALLLRRLGPDASRAWAEEQALNDEVLQCLFPVATDEGHLPLLRHLLQQLHERSATTVMTLTGPRVLASAVENDLVEVVEFLTPAMVEFARTTDPRQVQSMLAAMGKNPLLRACAKPGQTGMLQALIQLMLSIAETGKLPLCGAFNWLNLPMQQFMVDGRKDVLRVCSEGILAAAEVYRIESHLLRTLFEGSDYHAWHGAAARPDRLDIMRWWHELVVGQAQKGSLEPKDLETLLLGPADWIWTHRSIIGASIVRGGSAPCLAAHLEALEDASTRGLLPRASLLAALGISESSRPSIAPLILAESTGDLLQVWTDALERMHHKNLLSTEDVGALLLRSAKAMTSKEVADSLPATAEPPLLRPSLAQLFLRLHAHSIRLSLAGVLSEATVLAVMIFFCTERSSSMLEIIRLSQDRADAEAILQLFVAAWEIRMIDDLAFLELTRGPVGGHEAVANAEVADDEALNRLLQAVDRHHTEGTLDESILGSVREVIRRVRQDHPNAPRLG